MLRQAEAQYQAGGVKLRDEVRLAYDRLAAALQTYRLISDTLLPRAEETFKASLSDYQSGKIPFMSLNEALMQTAMQKMDQAMALADVQMARAELVRLTEIGDRYDNP
jgi:outer membrane protein TolC